MSNIRQLTNLNTFSSPSTASQRKVFSDNYEVFAALPKLQQQAIAMQALILYCKNTGSSLQKDYTSLHTTLVSDAEVFLNSITRIDPYSARLFLDWDASSLNNTGVSADIPTLLGQVSDLMALPNDKIEHVLIYLRCCLGL